MIKNKAYTGWCFQTIVSICNNFNHSSQVWLKHVETQFSKYLKPKTTNQLMGICRGVQFRWTEFFKSRVNLSNLSTHAHKIVEKDNYNLADFRCTRKAAQNLLFSQVACSSQWSRIFALANGLWGQGLSEKFLCSRSIENTRQAILGHGWFSGDLCYWAQSCSQDMWAMF